MGPGKTEDFSLFILWNEPRSLVASNVITNVQEATIGSRTTIQTSKMKRRQAVNVLGILVSAIFQKSVDDSQVPVSGSMMQRRKVVNVLCIHFGAMGDEPLNGFKSPFATEWCSGYNFS
jgi:hypothetical protein